MMGRGSNIHTSCTVHFKCESHFYVANYLYFDTDNEPTFIGLARYNATQDRHDHIEIGREDVPLPEYLNLPPHEYLNPSQHEPKDNVGKQIADIEIKGFNIDDEIDALIGREK